MDKNFLLCHMTERFRSLYNQVLDEIAESSGARRDMMIEVAFHDALLELMRHGLQSGAQLHEMHEENSAVTEKRPPGSKNGGPLDAA